MKFLRHFLKGSGGKTNFSMLVQDSLPIDTTIAMLEFANKKLSKSTPPTPQPLSTKPTAIF
jgi:hypothetical protein